MDAAPDPLADRAADQAAGPTSDLSRTVALVPVRGLEHGKTRLATVLDAEERADLSARLAGRTLDTLVAARDSGVVAAIVVASPDPFVLASAVAVGAIPLPVEGHDLVGDLRAARERAVVDGATAVVVVPIDLARISGVALHAVVAGARAAQRPGRPLVALVSDVAGEGTNVLLVSPPRAIDFAFGPGSRGRHASAAGEAGAVFVELRGPLTLDVDTAEDLAAAGEAVANAGPATGSPL